MVDNEIAVSVQNIHKNFILPMNKSTSLKQLAVNMVKKNRKVEQHVLDDISFDIHKGDFFGIIGRNGSGKSTLLKLLAGVYTPTSGTITINGGLTPFIELGVGFNPELSGRDNVYLNGALLGYTRDQMDEMYDEIVGFAELESFMDQKLKNYSSGMQVRLAFSIAIKAKNDILIFDEVLAVGDEAFQRKCLDVFDSYKATRQTIVLVTHDMETVRTYCNRAILIHDGKIVAEGSPKIIADKYTELNQAVIDGEIHDRAVKGKEIVAMTYDRAARSRSSFKINEPITIKVKWPKTIRADVVMIDIFKATGEHVTNFKSNRDHTSYYKGKTQAQIIFHPRMTHGKYYMDISLRTENNDEEIAVSYKACEFILTEHWDLAGTTWSGLVPLEHKWY